MKTAARIDAGQLFQKRHQFVKIMWLQEDLAKKNECLTRSKVAYLRQQSKKQNGDTIIVSLRY